MHFLAPGFGLTQTWTFGIANIWVSKWIDRKSVSPSFPKNYKGKVWDWDYNTAGRTTIWDEDRLETQLPTVIQLLANAQGKASEDGPSTGALARPGSALLIVAIWRINQYTESRLIDRSVSRSVSQSLSLSVFVCPCNSQMNLKQVGGGVWEQEIYCTILKSVVWQDRKWREGHVEAGITGLDDTAKSEDSWETQQSCSS